MDRCTSFGLRFNQKCSIQSFQPLPHADEAKSSRRLCAFDVKTSAGVTNREMNFTRRSPQAHFEVSYAAVFRRIVEGFLQNSEETKRSVWRQEAWQIVGLEVNLHVLLLAEFFAETSDGGRYAQMLQFCRV